MLLTISISSTCFGRNYRPKHVELIEIINKIIIVASSWLFIQGDSLARGPKLLSMYIVEWRGFLFRKYWQTGSFKARQETFRTEFGERRAPSKCCIQKLVKKLETRGSRSNACRLLSFGAYLRAECTKNTPRTIEQLKDAVHQEIQAVNFDTLGKVFQNLEKRFQLYLDVKGDQFQHRL